MVRIGKNSRHLRVFHIILHKKKKTKRSWTNYIRDCVKWIIKTHHIDISNKIENSGSDFSSYRQRDKTLVWSLLLHSYANRTAARTHAHTHVSRFTRIWEMIVFETRTKKKQTKMCGWKIVDAPTTSHPRHTHRLTARVTLWACSISHILLLTASYTRCDCPA